jgi:hypothetical protein
MHSVLALKLGVTADLTPSWATPGQAAPGTVSWFMTRFECRGAHGCDEQWTQGTRGFIQVQASQRIIALRPMCTSCIMIAWVKTPSTPLLYAKGVGFTWKI